jgi:hypothetical protein
MKLNYVAAMYINAYLYKNTSLLATWYGSFEVCIIPKVRLALEFPCTKIDDKIILVLVMCALQTR